MSILKITLLASSTDLVRCIGDLVARITGCQFELHDLRQSRDDLDAQTGLLIIHEADAKDSDILRQHLSAAVSERIPVIVIVGADRSTRGMLEWMELGAVDCLSLPLNLGRLSFLLDSLTLNSRHGVRSSRETWLEIPGAPRLCVASDQMRQVCRRLCRAAQRDANILISGETGTGKTHLAQLIHFHSSRRAQPFLSVNCGAIPESLVESELFGHLRGSFTSAVKDREGVFSKVGSGTLFLDEIDALPLGVQAKLLHVVDDGNYSVVGESRIRRFEGRLVTATNQDLTALAGAGRFRRDLLFRLKVLHLDVPPLRLRREEIPLLARHYIEEAARRHGCAPKRLSSDAEQLMIEYSWPGNVRELQNVLENALAFGMSSQIEAEDIPILEAGQVVGCGKTWETSGAETSLAGGEPPGAQKRDSQPAPVSNLKDARKNGERGELHRVLEANDHNRSATARQLGISRSALYKRLQKLGMI